MDASVAVKWHLTDEPLTAQALSLFRRFLDGEVALFAPEHIRYEVPSAITGATRRSPPRLSDEEGTRAVEEFLALGLTTLTDNALLALAFPLARRYGCSYYDAVYVALAQRSGFPFVTADERLYRRISALREAVWLGDLAIV